MAVNCFVLAIDTFSRDYMVFTFSSVQALMYSNVYTQKNEFSFSWVTVIA